MPFVFSGITVAIALTRFPPFVGRLYAVDLLGAATGAIAIVVTLEHTDALDDCGRDSRTDRVGAAAFRSRRRTGASASALAAARS